MGNKTIQEWLSMIKDSEIRNKAINNIDKGYHDVVVGSFQTAIYDAFEWSETSEGDEYWSNIAHNETKFI